MDKTAAGHSHEAHRLTQLLGGRALEFVNGFYRACLMGIEGGRRYTHMGLRLSMDADVHGHWSYGARLLGRDPATRPNGHENAEDGEGTFSAVRRDLARGRGAAPQLGGAPRRSFT